MSAAQDMGQLIGFRALQGLGAGALLPLSLAMVADLFPPNRSGRVQGALGGVMALSYIAGPFLGGVFTDQASWRWAFLVNLPIGLVLIAIIVARLPHVAGQGRGVRPDYLGMAVFSAGIGALLVGLTEKGLDDHAWTSGPVLWPIAASAVLLAAFVLVERRAEQPIIPLELFRNRTYTLANVASFFTAFCLYAGVVFLPRYFQEAMGLTATESGLRIYPLMLGMVVGSMIAGALISRTQRYKPWLVAGPFLIAVGALLCAFRQVGGSVALAIAGTVYASVIREEAPVHGLSAAHAAATATVVPWLAVGGALIALAALALLPGGRIGALTGRPSAVDG
ncbi:MFS transporter [Streptosporangium subroseum]|uniref:MFS transporter n=1 Tax=Streptosporangium subroseum TaxID=106412 RepID=UPI003413C31B